MYTTFSDHNSHLMTFLNQTYNNIQNTNKQDDRHQGLQDKKVDA